MNQADCDRILQLVAYIKGMDYQTKQAMMDGSNYDRMFDALQAARKLCNDVVASLDSVTALEWTQDKPRREGWYWAERIDAGLPMVSMVFVTRITRDYTHVWDPNARKEHGVSDFDWWQGPLYCSQLPKEVTP